MLIGIRHKAYKIKNKKFLFRNICIVVNACRAFRMPHPKDQYLVAFAFTIIAAMFTFALQTAHASIMKRG